MRAKGARCVHISTDYVFEGSKTEPYTEEDEARPISIYGASKLGGEESLHSVSERHLAVRVSWVFGPDRPSFVDQILQRALEHESVAAIADKVAVPTYTLDASRLLRPLMEPGFGGRRDPLEQHGIVHLAGVRAACAGMRGGGGRGVKGPRRESAEDGGPEGVHRAATHLYGHEHTEAAGGDRAHAETVAGGGGGVCADGVGAAEEMTKFE